MPTSDRTWFLGAYRGDIDTDAALDACRIARWAPDLLDPEMADALTQGDQAHPDDPRRWPDGWPNCRPPWEPDTDPDPDTTHAFDQLVATNGHQPDDDDGDPWDQPEDRDAERHTDVGNARRLIAAHGHQLRWVEAWATWLIWDQRRWRIDTKGHIVEFAKQVPVALLDEATRTPDSDQRKKLVKWAIQSENVARIRAMVDLARSHPGIPVDPHELDADPWLLNVANGTLNLRTGQLGPHQQQHLITKLAPTRYDPDAGAPQWDAFLERVVPDPEVRRFLQRWAGYCLTGSVAEHKLVFAYGVGANGKTTFSTALAAVLGDYATQAAPDLLMRRHDDPHPTGLADLHGARLVLATETSEGRHLDEALVKRLTGGDRVKARRMHRDFFEFDPTHKFVVGTNHRPTIDGTDHGIWRRVRLVPFHITIPDDQQDKQLELKLAGETAGILAWALAGCLDWQHEGLTEPAAVTAATADYRTDMDVLGEFMSERCVQVDGVSAKASVLYEAYRRWSEDQGERRPLTPRRLGLSLRERGFTKRSSNGVWWDGIALRASGDTPTRTDPHEPHPPRDEAPSLHPETLPLQGPGDVEPSHPYIEPF